MGKKRITQLLDQLHTNHQADLNNAAQIFTVAQVAVNQLSQQAEVASLALPFQPFHAPVTVDQAVLKERYGSFNGCRQAARQLGIQFHRTPTWAQLVAAFNYFEALQALVQGYITTFPDANLRDVTMAFRLKTGSVEDQRSPKLLKS